MEGLLLRSLFFLVGVTRRGLKPADSLGTVVYGVEHHSLSKNGTNGTVMDISVFFSF